MNTSGDLAIEVRGLTIRYGETTAVEGLGFTVESGTILALLGPNGAGKTSTVETLEGYRRPAEGSVRVLGLDPIVDHSALTHKIGVMLQGGGVYTGAKPPEVVRLFASYYDDPIDTDDLLDRVGLTEQARTTWRHLSGGEQQRLSLALALVGRPQVAFLDEPTSGIDPAGRQLIRQIIAGLREDGVTVLLTSHDLDEVEKLADHVVIVDRGHLIAQGSPAELMNSGHIDEIRFGAPSGLDLASMATHIGVSPSDLSEVEPGEYLVRSAPSPTTIAAITGWLADHDVILSDLRAGRQNLEDVFLRLTTSGGDDTAEEAEEPDGTETGPTRAARRSRSRRRRR